MAEYGRKSLCGQLRPHILSVGNGDPAAKDHQCSHGADHDGIQKHFHDTHQTLFSRHIHLCGSMSNGCGAHTGFVGKHTTGNTDAQCLKHGTGDAAGDGTGREGTLKDGCKGSGNFPCAKRQNAETHQKIRACGKGYQNLRSLADAF